MDGLLIICVVVLFGLYGIATAISGDIRDGLACHGQGLACLEFVEERS